MDGAAAASTLGILIQILFLDLLLSGDNAMLIALACRRLPEAQARRAAWLGAGGAILLRLILTLMTGALMALPFLQLLSALPLLVIALNLMTDDGDELSDAGEGEAQATMLAAASVIVVSDAAMSLDNVVALAAVSGGRFWLLAFGLALTVPLIVFGSFGFSHLMRAFPWVGDLGAAMLGWVAGGMIVGDPLLAGWVRTQAPALEIALPFSCAIFVFLQGRFARERAGREQAARPKPAPRPIPAPRPVPAPSANPAPRPVPAVARVAAAPRLVDIPAPAPETPAPAAPEEEQQADPSDRWMLVGLLALFAVFGLFLTAFLMIPD